MEYDFEISNLIRSYYAVAKSGAFTSSDGDAVYRLQFPEVPNEGTLCWETPINLKSLDSYIALLEDRIEYDAAINPMWQSRLMQRLVDAKMIYLAAYINDSILQQVARQTEFGRLELLGVNLQDTHQSVRNAALGDCVEFFIENSVYNWRLQLANRILVEFGHRRNFFQTWEYVSNTSTVLEKVAAIAFANTDLSNWQQINRLREAFVILSTNPSPEALLKIFDKELLDQLMSTVTSGLGVSFSFSEFIKEQRVINELIFEYAMSTRDLSNVTGIRDKKGDILLDKTITYLYQQDERRILDVMIDVLSAENTDEFNNILLPYHDAVFARKLPHEAVININYHIRKIVPEARCIIRNNQALKPVNAAELAARREETRFVKAHQQFIANEERRAREWAKRRIDP